MDRTKTEKGFNFGLNLVKIRNHRDYFCNILNKLDPIVTNYEPHCRYQ